jgi:hypothetical protein
MWNSRISSYVTPALKKQASTYSLSGGMGIYWNAEYEINSMITESKSRYHMDFCTEIMITGCWFIWDKRNGAIFNENEPTLQHCINIFKAYFCTIMHRAKPSLKEGIQFWLDTLSPNVIN